jgi:hypothetical protein
VLAEVIGAWLADRQHHQDRGRGGPPTRRRRAVAVDGKTLRGAHPAGAGGRPPHLLAAMDHTTRQVLAQRQVAGAPEEVPAFAPLLDGLDLAGVVVTAGALQTHPQAAEFLVTRKHAHYLFTVKANQPRLLERCASLPWHNVPVGDRTRDRGHGRIEIRTLKAVSVRHFGFPYAAQVLQITRKTRKLHTTRWQTVTVYAITSLPFEQARPARLAERPLDDPERPALGPRHHLRRGRLPDPHRQHTPDHGQPTQPRHRHPARPRTTTSPQRYAATPATPPESCHCSASQAREPVIPTL